MGEFISVPDDCFLSKAFNIWLSVSLCPAYLSHGQWQLFKEYALGGNHRPGPVQNAENTILEKYGSCPEGCDGRGRHLRNAFMETLVSWVSGQTEGHSWLPGDASEPSASVDCARHWDLSGLSLGWMVSSFKMNEENFEVLFKVAWQGELGNGEARGCVWRTRQGEFGLHSIIRRNYGRFWKPDMIRWRDTLAYTYLYNIYITQTGTHI